MNEPESRAEKAAGPRPSHFPPESVGGSGVIERAVPLPMATEGATSLQQLFLMLVETKVALAQSELLEALASFPDAVGHLLPLLHSTRVDVLLAVLRVVRHVGVRSAEPAVVRLSSHGATSVRAAVVTQLGDWSRDESDRTAVESLRTFLFDPDPGLRRVASHHLLACGASLSGERWHAAMRQETQVDVAECLIRLRPPDVVPDADHLRTIAAMMSARRPAEVLKVLLDDLSSVDASRAIQVAKHLRCHPRADYSRLGESLLADGRSMS
jgi:hypothetical protein